MREIQAISVRRTGTSATNWVYHCDVTLRTKLLFRKATEETFKCQRPYGGSWFRIDTGEYTDEWLDMRMEAAVRAHLALEHQ